MDLQDEILAFNRHADKMYIKMFAENMKKEKKEAAKLLKNDKKQVRMEKKK